jgi:hypothetical protein
MPPTATLPAATSRAMLGAVMEAHELTGLGVPWVPASSPEAARTINELVLAVETDQPACNGVSGACESPDHADALHGEVSSHYDLFLAAMEEAGADTRGIREFVAHIDDGSPVALERAFAAGDTPDAVRQYVRHILKIARLGSMAQVLGAFVPEGVAGTRATARDAALARLLAEWTRSGHELPRLSYYFARLARLDCGRHADRLHRVARDLGSRSGSFIEQFERSARESLAARSGLEDSVLAQMRRPERCEASQDVDGWSINANRMEC